MDDFALCRLVNSLTDDELELCVMALLLPEGNETKLNSLDATRKIIIN